MKIHRIIAIAVAAVLAVPTYLTVAAEIKADYKIVGYLPDWNYKPFSEHNLSQLTNINIAFCNPDENGRLSCNIPESKLKNIVAEATAMALRSLPHWEAVTDVTVIFSIWILPKKEQHSMPI